ncbi:MAG: choice-of-anchor J domain-containing protein, partial [Chryseobacterium sp.]|nr:choice-of-anchor J domain-containing protein [Chryseobacterium sp.]
MKKNLLRLVLLSIPVFGFSQSNVLLSEDFQSGSLPASWTVNQSNAVETWHVEDPLAGTDLKATVNYDESTAAQDEWLITPSLDFSASTTYTLTATIGLSYYWSVNPEDNYDAFIKVSTDNGVTWTQVWSEVDLGTFTNWVMNPVSVNLSSYAGNANV